MICHNQSVRDRCQRGHAETGHRCHEVDNRDVAGEVHDQHGEGKREHAEGESGMDAESMDDWFEEWSVECTDNAMKQ